MVTHGSYGFVIDGVEKIAFNKYTSYPADFGEQMLSWLRVQDIDDLKQKAKALVVVGHDADPTADDMEKFTQHMSNRFGSDNIQEWYPLLYELEDNLELTMGAGVMIDSGDCPRTDFSCMWTYLVDLDTVSFEIYKSSFGSTPIGRFADGQDGSSETGTSTFIYSWPLSELPDNLEEFYRMD